MNRLLLTFVLLVTPLQASWAAVTAYCTHENGAASKHFGHHYHKHQAASGDASGDATRLGGGPDQDCGFCHLGAFNFVQPAPHLPHPDAGSELIEAASHIYPSVVPLGLERPNWRVRA